MTNQLTWLVTGCTSGLGEALVQAILAKGDRVIATARRRDGVSGAERLSTFAAAGAAVMELDITASQDELNEKAKEAWNIYGHIDILANNAGFISGGLIEEIREDVMLNVIRTNVMGPMNLSRSLLPFMRGRKSGTLLFFGSVGPHVAIPGAASYIGSKGLLDAIVPSFALEVAPFGIRVCDLIFSYFETEIMGKKNAIHAAIAIPELAELHDVIVKAFDAESQGWPNDPKKGAALVVDAVRGEGKCAGKELPLRLPIGAEAPTIIREDCQQRLKICDEWDGVTTDTAFDKPADV